AATLPEPVADAVKAERLAELQAELNRQQRAFNRAAEGRVMPVLFDRPGRRPGQIAGRSPYMQAVYVDAPELELGSLAPVLIEAGHDNSLSGRPLARAAA